MSDTPSIIGLPDTYSYVSSNLSGSTHKGSNGKLLFFPGVYLETFYLIDYGPGNDITVVNERELEYDDDHEIEWIYY